MNLAPPLVVRFGAFGDTVLLTPLLRALALRWGRPVDLLSSGPWTPRLLANNPHVGHIQLLTSRRAPYWLTPSQWRAVSWLRKRGSGPVYFCERDAHGGELLVRAGVPPEHIDKPWDDWPGDGVHWADWWIDVARRSPAGFPAPPPLPAGAVPARPELFITEADRAACAEWLQRQGWQDDALVLVQAGHKKTHKRGRIGTAEHTKHWPAGHWAEVVRGVRAHLPASRVLMCGSPREHGLVQEIIDRVGDARVHNLARDLPIERLLPLAEQAHSMISVDTGPAHAAGAMNCPLVVLYSVFGSQRWRPRPPTAPVIALGGERGEQSRLTDIAPAQALAAWRSLGGR
jgi:heptosyltransferase-3